MMNPNDYEIEDVGFLGEESLLRPRCPKCGNPMMQSVDHIDEGFKCYNPNCPNSPLDGEDGF